MEPLHRSLIACGAGIASHLFYFRIGEHHMLPVLYMQLFALMCIGPLAALVSFGGETLAEAASTVLATAGSWMFGVYGSLVIYRLFFHPLRQFAGPWPARISDLWWSSQLSAFNGYHMLLDFHEKYGQYVRVGSNTLSITDPEIMQPTYGVHAKVVKADWYDGTYPHHSMHTTRDRAMHDRRRRVWAPAFSDKALRDYEKTVQEFNDLFVRRIGEFQGGAVNVTTWFNLYSFDVMGRLAFGKGYGMLESGKRHWALDLLTEGMAISGFRVPTWVFRALIGIPGAAGGYHKFLNFCSDELRSRVKNGSNESKDITGWLLKAYANENHPEEDPMLQGDSRLIVVAGSDTTSATLTYLFYHLALDPSQQRKLREELKPLTISGDWADKDIQKLAHLNGAINESLRLHPPVPSGLMRKSPPEGLRIGDNYIPGNTVYFTPQYPMGRDCRIYAEASSFIPERWYSRPELIMHLDAFAPFSQGPFNCIGRNLAMMELRTLTARILLNYEVALAPGEDGTRLLTKTKDHFTLSLGQLDLVFTPLCK